MHRIAIDMDDVLADATGRFMEYAQKQHGRPINRKELEGYDWAEQAIGITQSEARKWLYEPGFFRGMAVMPDSQAVMKELVVKYEVFIVSAAVEFPLSMKEKTEWLQEHFPFIDWRFIVFCGHKYMIQADFLIDDHLRNLAAFTTGKPLMFTAPHNTHLNGYDRVKDWKDIAARFLNQ